MIGIIGHQKSRHSWRSMLTFLAIGGQHHSNLFIPFRNGNGLKESAFLITDNVTHTKYNSKLKNSKNLKLKDKMYSTTGLDLQSRLILVIKSSPVLSSNHSSWKHSRTQVEPKLNLYLWEREREKVDVVNFEAFKKKPTNNIIYHHHPRRKGRNKQKINRIIN